MFSGGIERDQRHEIDYSTHLNIIGPVLVVIMNITCFVLG